MSLHSSIESYLFISSEGASERKIASAIEAPIADVRAALRELQKKYEGAESGINLLHHAESWQLVSAPSAAKLIEKVIKEEQMGELTRPSLEALSIIAYRGPVRRSEIEYIRGIASHLILRNLMMRGLVEETGAEDDPLYQVTPIFLRAVGVANIEHLPQFTELHGKTLDELLQKPV